MAAGHVFVVTALKLKSTIRQSGHGLSDRDGAHVRVDGRVDLVGAVCGRADPFGSRDGSTVCRRMM